MTDTQPGAGPDGYRGPPAGLPDAVSYHMNRRFGVATPDAGVPELLHRLSASADPFLVVLDRQRRPMGVVCGLDVLTAESGAGQAGGVFDPVDRGGV